MATFKIYLPTDTDDYYDEASGQWLNVINAYAELEINAPSAAIGQEPFIRLQVAGENGEIASPPIDEDGNVPPDFDEDEYFAQIIETYDFFSVHSDPASALGSNENPVALVWAEAYGSVDFGSQITNFLLLQITGPDIIYWYGLVFIGDPPPIGIPYPNQSVTWNDLLPDTSGWYDEDDNFIIPEDAVFPSFDLTPYLLAPCFTRGTYIHTATGPRLIEELLVGDMIETVDHGLQPIRWIGSRSLSAGILASAPKLRPIRITAGALGDNLPAQDLLVSRQHRMMVRSKIAERTLGVCEALVAAGKLTELPGIFVDDASQSVEYFHMLFDRHEVVIANGAQSESLHTGPIALRSLPTKAQEEIFAIFPELREIGEERELARMVPRGRALKTLVETHGKRGAPLQAAR